MTSRDDASRGTKNALQQAGLDPADQALIGAQSGIALETALRRWAVSEGFQSTGRDTLDVIVKWLRANNLINNDEKMRLEVATITRNHCAHGRWHLLAQSQVQALLDVTAEFVPRAMSGICATPNLSRAGLIADVILEPDTSLPRLSRSVGWAFKNGTLELEGGRAAILFVTLLMLPILFFAAVIVNTFQQLFATFSSPLSKSHLDLTNVVFRFVLSMMGVGISVVSLKAGLWRLLNAVSTGASPASRLWVTADAERSMLRVDRSQVRKALRIVSYKGSCNKCGGDLALTTNFNGRRARLVAECVSYPSVHRFSVDPSTLYGRTIAD